ncbi:stalk domain-containing protein [Moorella sulfitireducens]|uniref:stalk domain-containing protein n=1 Tax=Neomoorella sulfitireducens TaxID=2972948 RepID=UPI0021AC8192|nr:stalk domain-containing protein [Moorella sulfitireducens]
MLKRKYSSLAWVLAVALLLAGTSAPAWALYEKGSVEGAMNSAAAYLLKLEKNGGILSYWSYIALAASGKDLNTTQAGRACENLLAAAKQSGDMNYYTVLVLAVLANGGDPYNYLGENIIKQIQDAQLPSGKFADNVKSGGEQLLNAHIWAILALQAAGAEIKDKEKALGWLAARQHADGSFYWYAEDQKTSDVDSTGMALMALGALGEDMTSPVVQKAVAYLEKAQKENGCFESWGAENAESCSTVIEGLVAVGLDPLTGSFNKTKGDVLAALLGFQLADGSFEHIAGTGGNEIATTQALMALGAISSGRPFYERLKLQPAATSYKARFVVGKKTYAIFSDQGKRNETMDAAPFIENGRTYVPLRYLAYALDVPAESIFWDQKNSIAKLVKNGRTITLTVGQKTGYIDGNPRDTGVAPILKEGRVYLPARFVAEAFGYKVNWDAVSQTVSIITGS